MGKGADASCWIDAGDKIVTVILCAIAALLSTSLVTYNQIITYERRNNETSCVIPELVYTATQQPPRPTLNFTIEPFTTLNFTIKPPFTALNFTMGPSTTQTTPSSQNLTDILRPSAHYISLYLPFKNRTFENFTMSPPFTTLNINVIPPETSFESNQTITFHKPIFRIYCDSNYSCQMNATSAPCETVTRTTTIRPTNSPIMATVPQDVFGGDLQRIAEDIILASQYSVSVLSVIGVALQIQLLVCSYSDRQRRSFRICLTWIMLGISISEGFLLEIGELLKSWNDFYSKDWLDITLNSKAVFTTLVLAIVATRDACKQTSWVRCRMLAIFIEYVAIAIALFTLCVTVIPPDLASPLQLIPVISGPLLAYFILLLITCCCCRRDTD